MGIMKRISTAKIFSNVDVKMVVYGTDKPSKEQKKIVKEWQERNNIKKEDIP